MNKKPSPPFAWQSLVKTNKAALRGRLLNWYAREARDLPWRGTRDPYRVWVSEIMLQQTRVETVIPYYNRFVNAYPSVQQLADAPEDEVLKHWEGLGYYSRALNLLKGAREISRNRGGVFPETAEAWMGVPGVGRYTAGAIASIALDLPAPILDGNVKRVLSRWFAVETNIAESATLTALWDAAEELVRGTRPGDFNQALMELGARVCLPRRPLCAECPAAPRCEALKLGRPADFPVRRAKPPTPHKTVVAAAIKKNGRYLLGKRPEGALLGGLWEFPGGKVEEGETHQEALIRELREELGVTVSVGRLLTSVDHAYSHYGVTIHLYECRIESGRPQCLYHAGLAWAPKSKIGQYALPKANHRFLDYL